ncbi:tripartite tricarboxylate transporter TctB family protein [Puniceibacterium sp. IMCC21224]|uniref:tripartite tricarboxylate transporter TctB family protein n=1 Tax=Puniceibacterium sp. IMCC21224 TaxID=1618204 RepID=UPI00064E031A|nr:tripartite tricarboxylate transporter TctB family protein [Puniceibacterium sp. IMCC21224]KMK68477.1 Tripartite tricarboxylate transporter TctB family [Puniceibacterium sp. IMCC21224]
MRIAFLLAVLAGGVFYTYIAFTDLSFLTRSGRLGPGFFPRIIGLSMVTITIWCLVDALREARADEEQFGSWRDVVILIVVAVLYAVLLRLFGGFVATFIYLVIMLSILNRGRHVQNAVLSLVLPVAVYLLFDKILNASMPPALFDLPI